MAKFSLSDDRVVIIVGSGASGGTVAESLCVSGIDVVMLESGRFIKSQDFFQDEDAAYTQLAWKDPRIALGNWRVAKDNPESAAWLCEVVGGTTVHWTGTALRMKKHEFKALSTYGKISGTDLADWPISLEDLEKFYQLAERKMGVSGTNGLSHHPTVNNFKVMYDGAKKAGYKMISRGRLAINAKEYMGRPGSGQDGFTISGDRRRAKWSTAYVEIPNALATGRLDLRASCRAIEIELDQNGKAKAVIYVDKRGEKIRQLCSLVVVAGNAIETPRLLLSSASAKFPNGLGNNSDRVGRCFMRHMTSSVWSVFEKPVRMYRGEMMPGLVSDEAVHDKTRGFSAGYYIQLLSLSLPAIASSINPGWWGKDFAWAMEHYGSMAGMYGLGEDMPQLKNRISLHPTRVDKFGVPLAQVYYDPHDNDIAMLDHSYKSMENIHMHAGAVKSYHTPPFPASHNMGTARMSLDPAYGVVNEWGALHEVSNIYIADGSIFTTSSAANPTLTIVALALRQSERLKTVLNAPK